MRIIIYALGKIYEREKEQIDWSQVTALADKSIHLEMENEGVPKITPDQIKSIEYDYVAIFSNQFYEEIRMELAGEYSVPLDKILPWTEVVKGKKEIGLQMLEAYGSFLEAVECEKILDAGMRILPNHYLTKTQFFSDGRIILDGILGDEAIINNCLYDNIYESYKECKDSYDAVLLWENLDNIEAQLNKLWDKKIQTRYVLLSTGYLWRGKHTGETADKLLQKYGKVFRISNIWGILWIIDTQHREKSEDMHIYVAMHKEYNMQANELYVPLCVGGFQKSGYLNEQIGENIAYLNPKINECTALYWIWKNTDTEYVGLNHYRRYFYKNEIKSIDNRLDRTNAADILQHYDIILTKVRPMGTVTVYGQIYNSIDHTLCERGYFAMRRGIERHQPEYLQVFDDVMKGHNTFLCNMFIARREILNDYCEWLFSFLIEAAEETDVEGYDSYSRRVIGFFAERMWTVWLRKNKLRIKEMPYVAVK